ncbi:hypothetical protein SDJN03_17834, partial [Cucurbita argyrosperma subsp. sororia]
MGANSRIHGFSLRFGVSYGTSYQFWECFFIGTFTDGTSNTKLNPKATKRDRQDEHRRTQNYKRIQLQKCEEDEERGSIFTEAKEGVQGFSNDEFVTLISDVGCNMGREYKMSKRVGKPGSN